jgi:hypothetical protein
VVDITDDQLTWLPGGALQRAEFPFIESVFAMQAHSWRSRRIDSPNRTGAWQRCVYRLLRPREHAWRYEEPSGARIAGRVGRGHKPKNRAELAKRMRRQP